MKGNDWKDCITRQTQRLGRFKYPLLILALGVVLLAIPTKEEATPQQTAETAPTVTEEETGDLEELETKLSRILSSMEGAGRVEVILRYSAGPRTVYQTDSTQEVSNDAESKTSTVTVDTVLAASGGSSETPLTVQTMSPSFEGAVVAAEGADSAAVKLNLVNAVSSLTGLGAGDITVIKMK